MKYNNNSTRVKAPANKPDNPTGPIQHDVGPSLKPQGRGGSENSGRDRFIDCKRLTMFSTMNVRTIRKDSVREELAFNFEKQQIDVLGIQEHRIVHDDELVQYLKVRRSTLITSSAWRSDSTQAAEGGVGLLLSRRGKDALTGIKSVSDRTMVATFNGNPATTVVCTYCPTSSSTDDVIEGHYNILRRTLQNVPAHNLLVVVGDFNARLGLTDVQFPYKDPYRSETNRNGQKLLDLAMEQKLDIANTRFQKKAGKKWTFLNASGKRRQLDYILTNSKWWNGVTNCEAYNTFASVGSDHRMVTAIRFCMTSVLLCRLVFFCFDSLNI